MPGTSRTVEAIVNPAPSFVRNMHQRCSRHYPPEPESPLFRELVAAGHPDSTDYQRLRHFYDQLPWFAVCHSRFVMAAEENMYATMSIPRLFIGDFYGSGFEPILDLGDPARARLARLAKDGWPADIPHGIQCNWSVQYTTDEEYKVDALLSRLPRWSGHSWGRGWRGISGNLCFAESLVLIDWLRRWKPHHLLIEKDEIEVLLYGALRGPEQLCLHLPLKPGCRDAWL